MHRLDFQPSSLLWRSRPSDTWAPGGSAVWRAGCLSEEDNGKSFLAACVAQSGTMTLASRGGF